MSWRLIFSAYQFKKILNRSLLNTVQQCGHSKIMMEVSYNDNLSVFRALDAFRLRQNEHLIERIDKIFDFY